MASNYENGESKFIADDSANKDSQANIILDLRYKLQKTFLSNKTPPKPEAMPEMDQFFTIIENYEMTIEQLALSKIGKVMRHISVVPDGRIPRDDEFKFHARAQSLVENWKDEFIHSRHC